MGAARRDGDGAAHRLGAEAGRGSTAQNLDLLDLLRPQPREFRGRRGKTIDEDGDALDPAHGDDAVAHVQPDAGPQHLHDVRRLLAGDVGGSDEGGIGGAVIRSVR